jgi:uncharacterized protein (TIGR02147 family)
MSLQKQKDFKEFLKKEFEKRTEKNPKYSLRAFSKHLDFDSSYLSKIFKGQRPINAELIESLGSRLGLNTTQIEKFKKYASEDQKLDLAVQESYQLKVDQLALISEWQHYAILEIMKHPQFQPSSQWISEHLHQPEEVILLAVERLKRIGILKINNDGTWTDESHGFSTHVLGENITSRAHRTYQAQILDLSKEALYHVPIEERDHSTICVITAKDKIQDAKLKIKKFRRELAEFLEDSEQKTEVYHFNIGLFPVPQGKD